MTARLVTALVGTAVVAAGVFAAAPAHAETVGNGPNGQRLTVSRTDLPTAGATVTVSGSGYDSTKGIYVAFCVDNGSGAAPSPCGGGVDMGGTSGLSHWISSNPPSYGEGLAVPYGSGGTFRVQLRVSPKVGDVDCAVRRCVVSTRNDHTRGADRSQDVRVPVTFAGAVVTPTRTTAAPPSAPAPGAGAPTSSRPTGGAPATAQPTGGPAGVTASAGSAAPADGGGAGAPTAGTEPAASQVTAGGDTGRWWTVVTAGLAVLLVVLVAVRVRNRRRERA
ncbi:hypothetical protein [Micromonospora echinospora]|uniref:hypothetical protein n=1 Tax=Micromonospora echinospora TaxID=1877 RepID=UPI00366BDECE